MDQQTTPACVAILEPGQVWAHPKDGPWGGHGNPATILDVKGGWVRYAFCGNDDERASEQFFREWFSVRIDAQVSA